MGKTAQDIIDCAKKYVGLVEKPDNNIIFNTKYYGREVSGSAYPWCCAFIWCLFNECGASDLFCGGQKTALCQFALSWYRAHKQFYKTSPQVGDLVFFKFGTTSRETNHIGIVTEVLVNGVKTIEGNTSTADQNNGGMVMERIRTSGIVGYGRPAYEKPKPIYQNVYPQKGIDVAAYQVGLDYSALRNAGVRFAIIKIIRKDLQPDKMFETHYKGFTNASIPILAVYNYSYATTVEKAKIDAKRVIEILNGRKIPVCLDVENDCQKNLGERLIQIINAYQSVIESAGLKFFVYTGLFFYDSFIKPYRNMLGCTQFWIARYPNTSVMTLDDNPNPIKKPDVDGIIAWQYTSKGRFNSYNGYIDFDILYAPIADRTRKSGYCTANSLRVRSTPSTVDNINVVGYLKKGDSVVIYKVDPTTGWYAISAECNRWVSNKYIQIT